MASPWGSLGPSLIRIFPPFPCLCLATFVFSPSPLLFRSSDFTAGNWRQRVGFSQSLPNFIGWFAASPPKHGHLGLLFSLFPLPASPPSRLLPHLCPPYHVQPDPVHWVLSLLGAHAGQRDVLQVSLALTFRNLRSECLVNLKVFVVAQASVFPKIVDDVNFPYHL